MQMQCDSNAANDFVYACINEHELLVEDDEFIWSPSLLKRMGKKDKKSEQAKKAAEARWKKSNNGGENNNSEDEQCGSNADAMQTQSERNANKGKESKGKESKGKNKERRKSKIYDTHSVYFRLANRLYQNILKNNPDHKEPNLHKWADDVRLMMEQDKRTEEQIEYLIDWVQKDSFWKSNILSISKLRQKFDQLAIRVKEDHKQQNQTSNKLPRAYQSLLDWAAEEDENESQGSNIAHGYGGG